MPFASIAIVPLRILLAFLAVFALNAQSLAPDDLLKRAITSHQASDFTSAIEFYTKYISVRPNSPQALSNLGAAYAQIGRFQDAITQYNKALKLQPGNAAMELNLGLAYYKIGQIEQAAATIE